LFAWALQGVKLAKDIPVHFRNLVWPRPFFAGAKTVQTNNDTGFPERRWRINGAATGSSQTHRFEISFF
jgi:hypothetical protein